MKFALPRRSAIAKTAGRLSGGGWDGGIAGVGSRPQRCASVHARFGMAALLAAITALSWLLCAALAKTPQTKPGPPAVTSKYGFESDTMGWKAQDYEDSRACAQVMRSADRAKDGRHSLKMMMNLVGGDENRSKGEAWVNMLAKPPKGERAPLNLERRAITAWVYAPEGARGERSRPNGFQVFVKDKKWRNEYGPWQNVVEGEWVKLSLTVSASEPESGWMDDGFDPKQIIAVGVKMGAGGESSATYKGPVYVDAVDW